MPAPANAGAGSGPARNPESAGGSRRALVSRAAAAAQAILHECLAAGALQPLGGRVRVAGRHLLLLAVLVRSLGDGLTGHNRERRTYRHQPCRASHTDSFREQVEQTPYGNPNAGSYSMSG